jgi:hypothetical protein
LLGARHARNAIEKLAERLPTRHRWVIKRFGIRPDPRTAKAFVSTLESFKIRETANLETLSQRVATKK